MDTDTWKMVLRVLLVGSMSATMPVLKGGSLMQPSADPRACEEAMHAGASCTPCVSKFKLCRGHFVYEPFTVVLFEAFATVVLGILATFWLTPRPRDAAAMLFDWRALQRVAPIGATYALGDFMDLMAASRCSATTLLVASQLRLPLCALLRSLLLGRGQTLAQWALLLLITVLCIFFVAGDLRGGAPAHGSSTMLDLLETIPLLLGKCVISCGGAVHAEHFLQHGEIKQLPLAVTQVHFKGATAIGAIMMGYLQGRRGGRIMATSWQGDLFQQLPPGTSVGDARTPFFGGWRGGTWALAACLVSQNFLIGDQMRRLSSVAKYVAYALGLALTHAATLASGGGAPTVEKSACCAAIALLAVAYVRLPGPRPKLSPSNGDSLANKKSD